MAKKKVTAKKTPKTQLKSVAQVEHVEQAAAPGDAPVEAVTAVPTPRGFVEEALQRVNEAIDKFELALICLNDESAGEFYKTIKPDDERKARLKAIGDYVNKSGFGLTSLRDEIMIALSQEKAHAVADKAPKIEFNVPFVPQSVVLPASTEPVTVEQLTEVVQLSGMALSMLAECKIDAFQYEQAGRILMFQKKLHESAKAELAAKVGA